jgi:oxygen-dependent protoporphyrinogen oxidase
MDNRLKRLPDSFLSFLRTDLLSWKGKWDIAMERFRPARSENGDESIDAFVRRRAGREAAEVLADGLVTGIHAGDPKLLSVRAAFPRLAAMEARYGGVLVGFGQIARERRREAARLHQPKPEPRRMWSLRQGLRVLIEALADQIPQRPHLGVGVRRLEKTPSGWIVQGDGLDRWEAQTVVLACPAPEQAQLLADLDPALSERIAGIAYNRVAVVALGYRQMDVPLKPDGFGFIAPERLRRDILGVQWCSSIFPERAPEDMLLFRALCGGWHRPEIIDYDDQRLLAAVHAELRVAQGITAEPAFQQIIRWPRAIPQYHLGHLEHVADIEKLAARHAGLLLAGNCYHGIALNDCTEQAVLLARRIAEIGG